MQSWFLHDAMQQTNVEMDATYDTWAIPTLTFGITNGDDIEPAQIHRIVATIGRMLAKTQQPTTDENDDELDTLDGDE